LCTRSTAVCAPAWMRARHCRRAHTCTNKFVWKTVASHQDSHHIVAAEHTTRPRRCTLPINLPPMTSSAYTHTLAATLPPATQPAPVQNQPFCRRRKTLFTFPPTCWLLLPWQESPHGKAASEAVNPVISTPHRLRTSEIPMPKLVSSAVTHHCQHALPFRVFFFLI